MKRVLVAEALDKKGIGMLKEHFQVDERDSTPEEELANIIHDYNGIMIKTYTRVSQKVIDNAGKLKVVARAGSGLDRVDIKYAESKGIVVRNTPEANIISVAELVFALLLAVARKVVLADKYIRNKSGWDRARFTGTELAQKNFGIIGLGNIGRKIIMRAQGFEMNTFCYDPYIDEATMKSIGTKKVGTLEELLKISDCITIHVPLLDSTFHLLSAPEFEMMKSGAILINTSRGPVVDEKALVAALKNGKIAGAGLDVFEKEPPDNDELLDLENVVLTTHIGAATKDALRKMTTQAAQVIINVLSK